MTTRRLIAAMLTLVLLVTSGTVAVARGHMASHAMLHVLCIDGEAQVVAVGADGAPIEEHPACPDCVIGALLALDGPAPVFSVSAIAKAADPAIPPVPSLQRVVAQASPARAPPVSV